MRTLWQSKVSHTAVYDSWSDFVIDFDKMAAMARPQDHKYDCYGWTPTVFNETVRPASTKQGARLEKAQWRCAEGATGELGLLYLDIDNDRTALMDGEESPTLLTMDDVSEALRSLDLSHILYASYSSTPEKPKFRVILPVSRVISYEEAYRLFVWFNACFGFQGDGSIYDPGDFLYGPPHKAQYREWHDGLNVDVDGILKLVEELSPAVWAMTPARGTTGRRGRPMTEDELDRYWENVADMTISAGVSISNPDLFNPDWLSELTGCAIGGSHRQTLLSVMSKVWIKSGGTLTFGEMQALQAEADATVMGGYCHRKYHTALADDLRAAMKLVAEEKPKTREEALDAVIGQKLRQLRNKGGSGDVSKR